MDKISITGGIPLHGKVHISGSKNAALPIMAASLLTGEEVILHNIPNLSDITTMANLLLQHGSHFSVMSKKQDNKSSGATILLSAKDILNLTSPYEIVRKMRASILCLGPLLARFGEAIVSLPGGCAIGTRPVDIHISALEQMGAKIEVENGYIHAKVKGKLKGAHIKFPKISVGATENILMAACLAEGETILENAATEPEITDLIKFLISMGAKIENIAHGTLKIIGCEKLFGTEYVVIYDRIEAGTYAVAASITRGEIELTGARIGELSNIFDKLSEAGTIIEESENGIKILGHKNNIKPIDIVTEAYPGFPTDMQAQFMALTSIADGESNISETIFENRFMHAPELMRMGADIIISGNNAKIIGVKKLKGAEVMATDLRASVSLVLAALAAEGKSIINRVYHLDRGYENLEQKLSACGAQISRTK